MFRAIGFVIGLYAISKMMSSTFVAFEQGAAAVFQTLEVAAVTSQAQIENL